MLHCYYLEVQIFFLVLYMCCFNHQKMKPLAVLWCGSNFSVECDAYIYDVKMKSSIYSTVSLRDSGMMRVSRDTQTCG